MAPSSVRCSRCARWSAPATPAARSSADGEVVGVVGVVFAASVTNEDTGCALTADQVEGLAEQHADSTLAVSTQDRAC